MKKFTAFLLAFLMVLGCVGCGNSNDTTPTPTTAPTAAPTTAPTKAPDPIYFDNVGIHGRNPFFDPWAKPVFLSQNVVKLHITRIL